MNDNLEVVILAAGLGTRMKSGTIKILHRAAGRPIIDYVLDLAADLSPNPPVMALICWFVHPASASLLAAALRKP